MTKSMRQPEGPYPSPSTMISYQVKEFFNWSETKFNNKTKNERTIKMDTSLESQISGLSFYVLFTLKLELSAQIKFYPA